jgi:Tol biopolymer transport system component
MSKLTRVLLIAACIFWGMAIIRADDPKQFSSWSAPTNLGAVINTAGNDSGPCISRDGLSLYFNSDGLGGYGNLDIFVSHRASVDEPWGPAQNLGPNINSSVADNAPFLSPDEHWLYFQSSRPGGIGGVDLYVARRHNNRNDFNWQPAVNLGSVVNTPATEAAPVYFEDDKTGTTILYFVSNRPGGLGSLDIYATTLQPDETWGPPVLVEELSSPFVDTQPTIRRDGLEMFISSNRPGSYSNTADIWVSTRESTSEPWSTPVNLGPVINSPSPYFQGRPSISFHGNELYFYAYRPGGFGAQDLYVSTRTKLKGDD